MHNIYCIVKYLNLRVPQGQANTALISAIEIADIFRISDKTWY